MVKYSEIGDYIKSKDNLVKAVYIHDMHDFLIRETVTRKGRYKVTLSFSSKEMLRNPNSIASQPSDFILRPLLLLLEQDWDKINKSDTGKVSHPEKKAKE